MKRLFIFLNTLVLAISALQADKLTLENDDRLTGTVSELADGKLTFKTSYAGTLTIPWKQIVSVSMEQQRLIQLRDGGEGMGTITQADERGMARLQAPSLPQRVRIEDIAAIREPSEPESWWSKWDGSAAFGFDLTRGNNEKDNISISARPRRENKDFRLTIGYQLDFTSQEGAEDNRIQDGSARYDRFFSDDFFYFFLGGFTTNQRQQLDLRTREGGGIGYSFRAVGADLSVYGGATAVQEKFEGLGRDNEVQGLAGVEFAASLWDKSAFATKFEYEPRLSEGGRYLLRWDAQWSYPLFSGLTIGAEFFDYFDSDPTSQGTEKNDFGVDVVFGWKF